MLIGERFVNVISFSLENTKFLVIPPVVYSITYPLACCEIQFTIMLVASNINALKFSGGSVGASEKIVQS